MLPHISLSAACNAGCFGDQKTWTRTLEAYRCGIDSDHCSPAEVGNLGVLLMLAGKGTRALQVFAMLEELVTPPGAQPDPIGRAAPHAGRRREETDKSKDAPASNPSSQKAGPHLLAALVLSGQWAQAHRCCQRMVHGDPPGATGL